MAEQRLSIWKLLGVSILLGAVIGLICGAFNLNAGITVGVVFPLLYITYFLSRARKVDEKSK